MIVSLPTLSVRSTATPACEEELMLAWCRLAEDNFMASPEWLLTAWEAFHRHENQSRLHCQVATGKSGHVAGIAAWYLNRKWGGRWLHPLGGGTICSDYARLPVEPSAEPTIYRALAEALASGDGAGRAAPVADVIEIDGHPETGPAWNVFFDTLQEHGWSRQTRPVEGTWVIDLPATWDELEARLHKSRRRKARKAFKLLQSGQISHQVVQSTDELARIWPEFVRLHQLRREQLGQPGCFADPRFGDFLFSATTRLMELGEAWLSMVSSDGRPLAILLMFDSGQRSSMYQSGIDVARMAMEPGHLVNTLTIAHAIRRGKTTFDLLRGDEPYKRGWDAQRIGLARTRMFAPTWRGRGLGQLFQLRDAWKTMRPGTKDATSPAGGESDADD
jgi:CelD/BcsL family acetyltransferase involved in cellulose biosynthesis